MNKYIGWFAVLFLAFGVTVGCGTPENTSVKGSSTDDEVAAWKAERAAQALADEKEMAEE